MRKDLQNVLRFVMAGLGHCIGRRFSRLVASQEKSQNGASRTFEKHGYCAPRSFYRFRENRLGIFVGVYSTPAQMPKHFFFT
jgi:hypothetical protein